MGTWGTAPFESDTAEDVLERLQRCSHAEIADYIERTLMVAMEGELTASSRILPEELVVAVSIVAANTVEGRELPWWEDFPEIVEWLIKPVSVSTCDMAHRALETALPEDSWYWRSWVDEADRTEAWQARASIDAVLQRVGK